MALPLRRFLLFLLPCLLTAVSPAKAGENTSAVPDSVFFNMSMELYDSLRTDSFGRMYDEALRRTKEAGNERFYITTRRMLVSRYSSLRDIDAFVAESDKVIRECKESGSEVATRLLYETYNFKADRLDSWGMKEEAIKTTQEMLDYAVENGHMKGIAMAKYMSGGFYLNAHQLDEADKCLREAWSICEENAFRELQIRVGFSRMGVLADQQNHEDGLKLADSVRTLIEAREAKGIKIAPVTRLKLASRSCKFNCLAGNEQEAEQFRKEMMHWYEISHDRSQTMTVFTTDADCKLLTGRYDEACTVLDTLVSMAERHNNWGEIANFTYSLAVAQSKCGRNDQAVGTFTRFAEAKDSAAVQDCREQIDELIKKYELNELLWKERRTRYRLSLAMAAVILLLLTVIFYIFYARNLLLKNRALYKKVLEMDKKTEEEAEHNINSDNSPLALIFSKVNSALKEDKVFRNPSLNRDLLASQVGTNSKYLADAVREYSDGRTVNDLINWWRLREASALLHDTPQMSITEVGEEAGFGSSQTFFRLFKEHFGMTPSEYRKVAFNTSE